MSVRVSFSGLNDAAPTPESVRPFVLRAGDTNPAIGRILQDAFGRPIDLSLASVQFRMAKADDYTVVVDAPASIIDAVTGRVQYQWQAGDTDQAGHYVAEWAIQYNDGRIETVPKVLLDPIRISAGLT